MNKINNEIHSINGTVVFDATEIRSYYRGTRQTFGKCDILEQRGYRFVPRNNPRMDTVKKWQGYDLVRVAQTNSIYHGRSMQTLWAVRER